MGKKAQGPFQDPAFASNRTVPVHRWVPWIAGYSQKFAVGALNSYAHGTDKVILDPFAGVGTTLVEADRAGHHAIGFEINPYAAFVAQTKLRAHRVKTAALRQTIHELNLHGKTIDTTKQIPNASPPAGFRTRSPFYSPKVLRKVLFLMDFISDQEDETATDLLRLAFAATMVEYSNYSYEPSLSRKKTVGRAEIEDYPVITTLVAKLNQIADDSDWYRQSRLLGERNDGVVHVRSFLEEYKTLHSGSVDLIVTSPPYMNNYHYNRNTRPHMYWLEFCKAPQDLKELETLNFGTYWQLAREQDKVDLDPSITDEEIHETVDRIRQQSPEKGSYGGNGWANYAASYLNDCVRFLKGVKWSLSPHGTALVVIGNSIVQGIPVPTDQFLATIARQCGLEVRKVHVPRQARVGNSIINSRVRAGQPSSGAHLYESVIEICQQQ